MSDPLTTLSTLLRPVFADLAGDPAIDPDPVVRPSDRADAQVNGALPLAKRIGANPRELAQQVVDSGVFDDVATDVEVAGPGFVNVTFSPSFLSGQLVAVAGDDRVGVPVASPELTVVVDYSAPNVAKEMHVGHLRSTVIGDALVRIMEFLGHEVVRENHIGDWGRPFGMLIEHLLDLGEDVASDGLGQGDLDGFYKAANAKFNDDEEFAGRARDRVVLLQSEDPATLELWHRLVEMSAAYFNRVYDQLDVLLTDDDLAGESRYQPLMQGVYARLEEHDLVREDDGAMVVDVDGFTNREGEPLPMIVKSRTGAFMYATSDLACVVDRVERLGADLMLYVIGTPQAQHLQMVFAVCEKAGWLAPGAAVHVGFGSVLGDDRKMLRSRSGASVKLVDLLEEAVERADAAIAEKNPELSAEERAAVAKSVGIGAVKYADLSTDRVKDYVFDFDRMLAFEGNTGPYCQYAHARINQVFRKARIDRTSVRRDVAIGIDMPQEKALAMQILAFPTAVDAVLEQWQPHKLCTYVYELASAFSSFYEHCPILTSEEPVRSSRLALADLTGRVLERALGLLGIDAPDQM